MKKRFVNFMLSAVILLCAVFFTGCFFLTDTPNDGPQTGTPSEGTQTGTPSEGTQTPGEGSQTGGSESKPQQDKKEGVVGDIIKTDDWDISLVYVKSLSSITGKYSEVLPSEGKKFLVFFMECKNNQKHISTLYSSNFDAYVDGLALTTPDDIILNNPDNWEITSLGTHYDHRMRMTLIYEAPAEWEKAELVYKGNMFLSNVDAKFSVGFEDLAAGDYKHRGSPFGEYAFDEQKITTFGTAVEDKIWKIKLLNAREYTQLNYSSAEEGKKYVAFFFEVENISSESQHFNIYDLNFYYDGYSLIQELHLSNIEGYEELSGDVISGAKREGFILIEVDESYKNIEIFYDDISDSEACFAVSAEMIRAQEDKEE